MHFVKTFLKTYCTRNEISQAENKKPTLLARALRNCMSDNSGREVGRVSERATGLFGSVSS